jgi:hypothetical protein
MKEDGNFYFFSLIQSFFFQHSGGNFVYSEKKENKCGM